jgi:hypothetical protein
MVEVEPFVAEHFYETGVSASPQKCGRRELGRLDLAAE